MSSEATGSPGSGSKDAHKVPGGDVRKFIGRATDELAALAASIRGLRAETGESAYEIRSRLISIEQRLGALEREFGMSAPPRSPRPVAKPSVEKRPAKPKDLAPDE